MREYSKVTPQFWTGRTGKALKSKGPEAVIVAMYLMTSPHSTMLGLYYLPVLYIAHETGLGLEGASKGLLSCVEAGFCAYDAESEHVWVFEMASYQIANELKAADNLCKGVQRDYEQLPANPHLQAFFDRYAEAFHMPRCRDENGKYLSTNISPLEAPSKPLRSQEQEQEQEQEIKEASPLVSGEPPTTKKKSGDVEKLSCPLPALGELWNSTVRSLPGVKPSGEWPKARQAALAARWVDRWRAGKYASVVDGVEYWRALFAAIEASDFLTGRSAKGWKNCSFDWVVGASNFAKIVEGNYFNPPADSSGAAGASAPPVRWDATLESLAAEGARFGVFASPGETHGQFKERVAVARAGLPPGGVAGVRPIEPAMPEKFERVGV